MAEEHHQVLSPEDMEIHVERGPPMTELSDVGPSEVSRLKLALSSSETTVANLKKGMSLMLSVFLDISTHTWHDYWRNRQDQYFPLFFRLVHIKVPF